MMQSTSSKSSSEIDNLIKDPLKSVAESRDATHLKNIAERQVLFEGARRVPATRLRRAYQSDLSENDQPQRRQYARPANDQDSTTKKNDRYSPLVMAFSKPLLRDDDQNEKESNHCDDEPTIASHEARPYHNHIAMFSKILPVSATESDSGDKTEASREIKRSQSEQVYNKKNLNSSEISLRLLHFQKHKASVVTSDEKLKNAAEQNDEVMKNTDGVSAVIISNENVRVTKNHVKRVPPRLVNRQRKVERTNGSSSESDSFPTKRPPQKKIGEKLDRSKSSLLPTENLKQNRRVTRRVPVRVRNRNRISSNISDTTSLASYEQSLSYPEIHLEEHAASNSKPLSQDQKVENCKPAQNIQRTNSVDCRKPHRMLKSVESDDKCLPLSVDSQQIVTSVSSTSEQSNCKQASLHDFERLTSKGVDVERLKEDRLMIENGQGSFEGRAQKFVDIVKQNCADLSSKSKYSSNQDETAISSNSDKGVIVRTAESYSHQKGILVSEHSNNFPFTQSAEGDFLQVHNDKAAVIQKGYENGLTSEERGNNNLEFQKLPKAKAVSVTYWPQDEETKKLFKSNVGASNDVSRNMPLPFENNRPQNNCTSDSRCFKPIAKETNLSDPINHQTKKFLSSQENQVSTQSANFHNANIDSPTFKGIDSDFKNGLPNGAIFCPKTQSVSIRRSNVISQSSFTIANKEKIQAGINQNYNEKTAFDGKDLKPVVESKIGLDPSKSCETNLSSTNFEKINNFRKKKSSESDSDSTTKKQPVDKKEFQNSLKYQVKHSKTHNLNKDSISDISYSSDSSSMQSEIDDDDDKDDEDDGDDDDDDDDAEDDENKKSDPRNPISLHQVPTFYKSKKRSKKKSFSGLQSKAIFQPALQRESESDEDLTVTYDSLSELTLSDHKQPDGIDELETELNGPIDLYFRSQHKPDAKQDHNTSVDTNPIHTSPRTFKRFSAHEYGINSKHLHSTDNLFRPINDGKETPETVSPVEISLATSLENSLVQEEKKFNNIFETFKKDTFRESPTHVSHVKSRSEPLENITSDDIPMRARRNAVIQPVHRLSDDMLSSIPSKKIPNSNARALPATLPRSVAPRNFEDFKKLDTRKCVILNLLETEDSYVESLRILVENYLRPLKQPMNQTIYEPQLVDDVIFQVTQLLRHHQQLSTSVRTRYDSWDFNSVIGDLFIQAFSKDMLLKSYTNYINNFTNTKEIINNAIDASPAFKQILEQSQKESRQGLADLMIKPVQRVPRYELIIKDLLKHTPVGHPDYESLLEAQKGIHALAVEMNKGEKEDKNLRFLQEVEQLIEGCPEAISVPRRKLLHQEICLESKSTSKKERSLWLFNDMLLCTSIKKGRGSSMRRSTMNLLSLAPSAGSVMIDFTYRYRFLWKYSLSELDITRDLQKIIQPIRDDLKVLADIEAIANKLSTVQKELKDLIKEMKEKLNQQLTENEQNASIPNQTISQLSLPDNRLEIKVFGSLGFKVHQFEFDNKDYKLAFEKQLIDAHGKYLDQKSKWGPTFLKVIPISKTRNGLQFSCATSNVETQPGIKEVWVCNTDGHVGQICFLTVDPDPQQTQCLTVCNAKICCIAQVPPWNNKLISINTFINEASKTALSRRPSSFSNPALKIIAFDESDDSDAENKSLYSTFSSVNSVSNYDLVGVGNEAHVSESTGIKNAQNTFMNQLLSKTTNVKPTNSSTLQGSQEKLLQDNKEAPSESPDSSGSVWMGTEDGKIHVYPTSEPIRTSKQSVQLNHGAPVMCILHHFGQVFVALSNGDLIVYKFDPASGQWDFNNKKTISGISSATPITKMIIVNETELWCGCQNQVRILSTQTHDVKNFFAVVPEKHKQIFCMATSGLGVWIALDKNPLIKLFHATSTAFLGQIDIKQPVNSMLSSSDAIIRQHKVACLRVTSLLVCKDSLWAGTSAGVVVTMALPNITPVTKSLPNDVEPLCLESGHTGHVRFLTSVEVEESKQPADARPKSTSNHRNSVISNQTRSSMLVISGGDGYEDFDRNSTNEIAGKDDSTNHLLVWKV